MNRLYKVTAHCGHRLLVYYVVAEGTTAAEQMVTRMHEDNQWLDIEYFESETIASEDKYGKPVVLILGDSK